MSSDEYEYRYTRKSFKKNDMRTSMENDGPCIIDNTNVASIENCCSPRGEIDVREVPTCSCDIDPEGEVATILHKKCPVITLAQRQLQRLLDETDKVLCDNTQCCRSVYGFLSICKEMLKSKNKCLCVLIILLAAVFMSGMLFGAASCGRKFGRFNSPIFMCVDNYFLTETSIDDKEFRGIL